MEAQMTEGQQLIAKNFVLMLNALGLMGIDWLCRSMDRIDYLFVNGEQFGHKDDYSMRDDGF